MKIEHLKKEIASKTKALSGAGDEFGGLRKELEAAQKEAAALQKQLNALGYDATKEEQLQKVSHTLLSPVLFFLSVCTFAGTKRRGIGYSRAAGECGCAFCKIGRRQIRIC